MQLILNHIKAGRVNITQKLSIILKHFYSAYIIALFWNNLYNEISLCFIYILFLSFSIVLSHNIAYTCT